jgi:hypothetical protein
VLSDVLSREGHTQEAEKLQKDTLAALIRVVGPEDNNTLATQSFLPGRSTVWAAILRRKSWPGKLMQYSFASWVCRIQVRQARCSN